MLRTGLSSIVVRCGLLASCANLVLCASEFSGAAEVKKLLADNEYALLACKFTKHRLYHGYDGC
jgi:protein disulfide-isomerase A1